MPNKICPDVGCAHPAKRHGGDIDDPFYCYDCGGEKAKHSYTFVRGALPPDALTNGGQS